MYQIFGNGYPQNDGANGTVAPWYTAAAPAGPFPAGSPAAEVVPSGADGVRPAWFGGGDPLLDIASGGGISGILAQLASAVQQYIGNLGSALASTFAPGTSNTQQPPSRGEATFQDVTLGSVGDPHLSVSGTEQNANGTTAAVASKFDSMVSHADLFSTNDFGDGFRVSTTVTPASSNGVTQNASATASMNGGLDSVTMTSGGGISVTSAGNAVAIAPGQSITLSGGEVVTEAPGGSVSISDTAWDEHLTTTFAQNGSGNVDVTATGNNVTLAGALITGGTTPVAQPPAAVRRSPAFL
jgi:hypothetical protein